MSTSQNTFDKGALTDDMGRPLPELVLPFVVLAAVGLLVWVWRRSAEHQG